MFSFYILFLALERVRMVKFTPAQVPTIISLYPLTLFGKPCIVILDFPFQLPCQAKFLGFVLLSKILLTNQNTRFLKIQYFMKELKHKVNFLMWINIHEKINWAWCSWISSKYFNMINQLEMSFDRYSRDIN